MDEEVCPSGGACHGRTTTRLLQSHASLERALHRREHALAAALVAALVLIALHKRYGLATDEHGVAPEVDHLSGEQEAGR